MLDDSESAPFFLSDSAHIEVEEGVEPGTVIATVTAIDPDDLDTSQELVQSVDVNESFMRSVIHFLFHFDFFSLSSLKP